MIKHNLCAKLSANIIWKIKHCKHSKTVSNIFISIMGMGIYELILTIIMSDIYLLDFKTAGASIFMKINETTNISTNFYHDWLLTNAFVLKYVLATIITILIFSGVILGIYAIGKYIIYPLYKRYLVNVKDAYMQKKLTNK